MKKQKLKIEYDYEFDLMGVICPGKEYKLAWSINQALHIKLVKQPDIELEFVNDRRLQISNFLFETEHSIFRLLKNRAVSESEGQTYLINELKQFDYLIQLSDEGMSFPLSEVLEKLKGLSIIHYIVEIDVTKLKTKDNLIF